MRYVLPALLATLVFLSHSEGFAQVVQLPTFRQFTIGTTVLVPDRGVAYLGGVSHARYSSTTRGIPLVGTTPGLSLLGRSRTASAEIGAAHAYATATIHDLKTLDRAVLAAAEAAHPPLDPAIAAKARFLAKHVGRRRPASRHDRPARVSRSTTNRRN